MSRGSEIDWALRGRMRSPGRPPGGAGSTGSGSGWRSRGGCRARTPHGGWGVAGGREPLVPARWRDANGQPRRCRGVTCRSPSGRRSRSCGPRAAASARCAPDRPLAVTISRELRRNAATRGGGLEYRATTAQWHADRRATRPKAAKLAANAAPAVRARPAGRLDQPARRRRRCRARRSDGSAGGTAAGRTGAGPSRGARSRSRTGSGSTSPMMSPCGSRMRRSTRRSTSRAAERCAVS